MKLKFLCLITLFSCVSEKEHNMLLQQNISLKNEIEHHKCRIDSLEHINRYLQSDLNNAMFELNNE